jgi:4-hydroxy-tetrahydrodipicolinate synthase
LKIKKTLRQQKGNMMFDPREKIALFIDGANLYAASKSLGFDIDYRKLLKAFQKRGYLLRAYYYTASGAVDTDSFAAYVEWQISEGSHGLVPVGTTGESPTLSHAEHKRVVELCIETAAKRVPVIAGAGSNNTTEAVELAQHAEKAGADAVLVVTPYYNKPTQKGLFAHYSAIAESIKLPIVIYNIPGRSVVDMSVETMAALHKAYPSIMGVKDATGKIERVSEQRMACGPGFRVRTRRRSASTHMVALAAFP